MSIYSTRFIGVQAAAGTYTYTVPAGKRAVVKCADWQDWSGTAENCYLIVAGNYIFEASLSGSAHAQWTGMAVAMAGETIGWSVTSGNQASGQVSGYLFNDP